MDYEDDMYDICLNNAIVRCLYKYLFVDNYAESLLDYNTAISDNNWQLCTKCSVANLPE